MKIVIDRDKEVNKLKEMIDTLTDKKDLQSVRFAINILENIEGAPLPEGHGRLIDADKLELDDGYSNYDGYYHKYSQSQIHNAPTVLEAERSDTECRE